MVSVPAPVVVAVSLLLGPGVPPPAGNGEFEYVRQVHYVDSGADQTLSVRITVSATGILYVEHASFGSPQVQFPEHDARCDVERPRNALDFTAVVRCDDGTSTRKRFRWRASVGSWEVTHQTNGSRVLLSPIGQSTPMD